MPTDVQPAKTFEQCCDEVAKKQKQKTDKYENGKSNT